MLPCLYSYWKMQDGSRRCKVVGLWYKGGELNWFEVFEEGETETVMIRARKFRKWIQKEIVLPL